MSTDVEVEVPTHFTGIAPLAVFGDQLSRSRRNGANSLEAFFFP